ncbi:negative elongation factor A isoform X2 [Macaca nemestrina]|uniref:negative elongation factor A isoform X2 n=1 Tax=Macaca nemestrina TaxID=9545 RepID=UPI000D302ABA|nr:negative elongation factor A isoform X2 [Macaca nemestrina]
MGPSRRRLGSADCCPCVGGPSPGHVPAHRSQGSTLLSSAPPGADPCLSTPTRHPRAGAAPAVPGRVGQLLSSVSSLSQCANGMVRRAPSLRSWHHESHACPGGCVWALVGNGVGLRSVLGTGGQGSGGQSSSPGAWLRAPACGGTGRSQSSAPRAAPLKGIPKQAPFRSPTAPSVFSPTGNRTPIPPSRTLLRKERGVKLLDISELDMVGAGREAKRRRKTLDAEVVEKPAKEETVVENATPDYAAGLVSTQKLGSLNSEPALPSTSYLPSTPSVVPASSYIPSSETPPAPSSREASRPPEEPSTPSPTLPAQFKQRAPMYNSGLSPATPTPAAPTSPLTPTTPPAVAPTTQTPPVAMVAPQTQASAQQQPKKNLSLTREQMFAAQEMFKTANKVTRPEKALILGFMAGSRENPCQEQGDVIQIKLSEHTEDLPKADGQGSTTMLVDTVFEMNYATGQWTRFKKYKPMTNVS